MQNLIERDKVIPVSSLENLPDTRQALEALDGAQLVGVERTPEEAEIEIQLHSLFGLRDPFRRVSGGCGRSHMTPGEPSTPKKVPLSVLPPEAQEHLTRRDK